MTAYCGVKSTAPVDVFGAIGSTNNTTSGHGRHPYDDGERRERPRLLRKCEQLDVHPAGRLERARRRGGTGISGSTDDQIKVTAGTTGNAVATSTVSARVYGHQASFFVDNVALRPRR